MTVEKEGAQETAGRTLEPPEGNAGQAESAGAQEPAESMADYSEELEASFRAVREGDVMAGTVVDVNERAVTLDLNYFAPGVVLAKDVSRDPTFSILTDVKVGDRLEGMVLKKDDGAGNILLSCTEAAEKLGWDRVEEYRKEKTPLQVKVAETVNKGVVAYVEGLRGFIPASQLSLSYVEDLGAFVGQVLTVHVITVDPSRKKLVLSAKEVLQEQKQERLHQRIAMLAPGTVLEGRVESLMPYGAFVDLGDGLSGLVHISQISQKRIAKPSEALSVGDRVKVKVLNTKDDKVSLSIRAVQEGEAAEEDQLGARAAQEYSSKETVGTSLADLLKGLGF